MGTFLPRGDQESRAGPGYSWTTGIDYRRQLQLSGRRALVAALYRKAGLPLDASELASAVVGLLSPVAPRPRPPSAPSRRPRTL